MSRLAPALLADPARLATLRSTELLDERPTAALDHLARLTKALVRAPVAIVSLVDERRQFFTSAVGLDEPWATVRETPLSHSFCQHVVLTGTPLVVSDARVDPRFAANGAIEDLGVVAYAGFPLTLHDGQTLGSLCVIDSHARTWTDAELETVGYLAEAVVRELELRVRARALRERNDLLEGILANMEDAVVVSSPEGETLLYNEASVRLLGAETARGSPPAESVEQYGLFDADGKKLSPSRIPLARALAGETVRQAEILVRSSGHPEGRVHSVNASPLRDRAGAIIGGISVGRDVTELKAAQDAVTRLSLHDELTGLLNRRGFRELAGQHLRLVHRSRRGCAIFFADLDDMKPINDRFGHDAGDAALVDVAAVLRETCRQSDLVARVGGDEFAVLAIDCDSPESINAFRTRLWAHLDAANAREAQRYHLSLSVGWGLYDPTRPRSLDALIVEADARMYEQKRLRREQGVASLRATKA